MKEITDAFLVEDLHKALIERNVEFYQKAQHIEKDSTPEAIRRYHHKLWMAVWYMNAAKRSDDDEAVEPVFLGSYDDEDTIRYYYCPKCSYLVGKLYLNLAGRNHFQDEENYCPDCGVRLDWESQYMKYKEED